MYWDLLFFGCATAPPPAADMPRDWQSDGLGAAGNVRAAITDAVPQVRWDDAGWGMAEIGSDSLEFDLGTAAAPENFTVRVRGTSEAVLAAVAALATRRGWYALDTARGEWLHHSDDR